MAGIIKAVVIDPGSNKPASVAVQPKMDCVYMGIINVELYNPKPRIKAIKVPILKFPSFRTLKFTMDIGQLSPNE
jgi:hypothetical protein